MCRIEFHGNAIVFEVLFSVSAQQQRFIHREMLDDGAAQEGPIHNRFVLRRWPQALVHRGDCPLGIAAGIGLQ